MDEILRARKLTEEILARAASIKSHMAQVNRSMANMALIEEEHKARASREAAEAAKPPLRLMDLPDDLLRLVAACAGPGDWEGQGGGGGSGARAAPGSGAASLASLAITCRRWRRLAACEPALWENMCRRRWGVTERDAASVLILDPRQLHLAAGWPKAALGSGGSGVAARGILASVRGAAAAATTAASRCGGGGRPGRISCAGGREVASGGRRTQGAARQPQHANGSSGVAATATAVVVATSVGASPPHCRNRPPHADPHAPSPTRLRARLAAPPEPTACDVSESGGCCGSNSGGSGSGGGGNSSSRRQVPLAFHVPEPVARPRPKSQSQQLPSPSPPLSSPPRLPKVPSCNRSPARPFRGPSGSSGPLLGPLSIPSPVAPSSETNSSLRTNSSGAAGPLTPSSPLGDKGGEPSRSPDAAVQTSPTPFSSPLPPPPSRLILPPQPEGHMSLSPSPSSSPQFALISTGPLAPLGDGGDNHEDDNRSMGPSTSSTLLAAKPISPLGGNVSGVTHGSGSPPSSPSTSSSAFLVPTSWGSRMATSGGTSSAQQGVGLRELGRGPAASGQGCAAALPLIPGGDALEPVPLGWLIRGLGPGGSCGEVKGRLPPPAATAAAGFAAAGLAAAGFAAAGGQAAGGQAAGRAVAAASGAAATASTSAATGAASGGGGGDGGGGGEAEACCAGPNPWQVVYRDRLVGWRGVLAVFRWLQSHGCPEAVSGSLHRQQLLLALRYLHLSIGITSDNIATATAAAAAGSSAGVGGAGAGRIPVTSSPPSSSSSSSSSTTATVAAPLSAAAAPAAASAQRRVRPQACPGGYFQVAEALAAELLQDVPDMVPCLVSLLSNDSGLVVELAAAGLADFLALDQERLDWERAAAAEARRAAVAAAAAAGSSSRGGGNGGVAAAGRSDKGTRPLRGRPDDPGIAHRVLLSSNSGRAIALQLRDGMRSPGIVRQITRCLVNLWVAPPVPRVLPLPPPLPPALPPPPTAPTSPAAAAAAAAAGIGSAGPCWAAVPSLEGGVWQLQEFTTRGDPFNLIHTIITFRQPAIAQPGFGHRPVGLLDPWVNRSKGLGAAAAAAAATPWGLPCPSPPSPTSLIFPSGPVLSSSPSSSTAATAMATAAALPLLPLVGPDGRPLGGTAAALVALGGRTGTRWGNSGGGSHVVEVLGGGFDVLLPRGAPLGGGGSGPDTNAVYAVHGGSGGGSLRGLDTTEEFRLSGWLDLNTGEWHLERRCINVPYALSYKGYSDAHGCWGTYTVQTEPQGLQGSVGVGGGGGIGVNPAAAAAAAAAGLQGGIAPAAAAVTAAGSTAGSTASTMGPGCSSSVRRLRLFRLFRDPSLGPPKELMELLTALQSREGEREHRDTPGSSGLHEDEEVKVKEAMEDKEEISVNTRHHRQDRNDVEDPDMPNLELLYDSC